MVHDGSGGSETETSSIGRRGPTEVATVGPERLGQVGVTGDGGKRVPGKER